MVGRGVIHAGNSGEVGVVVRISFAVIILAEVNIEVYLQGVRIFKTEGQLSKQTFPSVDDISDTGRKNMGEFSMLKYTQVGAAFKKRGGVGV